MSRPPSTAANPSRIAQDAASRVFGDARRRWLRLGLAGPAALAATAVATLPGCALWWRDDDEEGERDAVPPIAADDLSDSDWARASTLADAQAHWLHLRFRGRKPTRYQPQWHQGRPALRADSERGSSVVRQQMQRPPTQPARLAFSWWVDALPGDFDVRARDTDDAVARVIVSFDADRDRFTARDAMLSELAQLLTGQPLPAATIEYVWDAHLPAGTVLTSSYSTRVRYIVAESGGARLSQWVDAQRDVHADFALAFNEPPAAITGVGVMTDANDTLGQARAWYGPLRWAG